MIKKFCKLAFQIILRLFFKIHTCIQIQNVKRSTWNKISQQLLKQGCFTFHRQPHIYPKNKRLRMLRKKFSLDKDKKRQNVHMTEESKSFGKFFTLLSYPHISNTQNHIFSKIYFAVRVRLQPNIIYSIFKIK